MADTVRFEVSGPVATITLNRPDRLNAMTEELIVAVLCPLEQVSADEAIRVLVLTGAGRGFCAGGDLGAMGEFAEPRTPGASIAQLRRLHRTTELLHEMPKPTIAAVNGPCAGAGLSWACACDLRIAAESAVFRTAFLSAGLTGDFGGTWLLTRLVGAGRARDLYFRNEKLSAAAALSMGLVGEVVPDGAVLGRVADLAGRLAEAPPHVIAGIKQNLNDAEELGLHAVLNAEAERQVRAALSHPSAAPRT
jgi:2-(1,2-epoxy-1,2-dihydrophenyl)acetyl-CoA isomerase